MADKDISSIKKQADLKRKQGIPSRLFKVISKNKKRSVAAVVVIIVLLLVVSQVFKQPAGLETFSVSRKTLKSGITANGEVKATKYADLKFTSPGKVAWLGVNNGDEIKTGQAIARLDTVQLNTTYQQAQNNFRDAEASVESVLDSVQGHENDETYAMRAKRTTAEVARDNAYEQVVAARDALSKATLYSPLNGTVVATNDLSNGLNLTGADLETKYIKIVDLGTLYFQADVDEVDYQSVSLNQETDMVFDSYPDQVCHGRVIEISNQGLEETGGVITVPVKVSFDYCFLNLVTGFNGQAYFIEKKGINTLVIPKKYLVTKDGGNYVWLQTGDSVRNRQLTPVDTGIETASEVEITKGLNEGDTIIFLPS